MFLKSTSRRSQTQDRRVDYYRLCESYRQDNRTLHFTVVHLGNLEQLPQPEQKQQLARRLEELIEAARRGLQPLFAPQEDVLEQLAQHFFRKVLERKRIDVAKGKDYHVVDINSIKNKQVREVGAEWLCLQAADQLHIRQFLRDKQWSEEHINLALTHIVSRAVYPASELRTSEWIRDNSGICELTGYPIEKISKDKLYAISHHLYSVKDELEQFLSKRTNELFDLSDRIILYDLTNTYFEGRMADSRLARFGRSKEKRSDARLVVLGVVVNTEGFVKYSNIYEGNTADSKTLKHIIEQMGKNSSFTGRKPIVVIDAGIATEDNIQYLRKEGYDYMVVARSGLKKYKADTGCVPIRIEDRKGQPITLQRVIVEGCNDNYLQVDSKSKALKESSMSMQFSQRFEEGMRQIAIGITKKGGVKKFSKVWERIGRLKQKYPSIHKYYEIGVEKNDIDIATSVTWKTKPIENREGQYLLRTSLNEKDEHTQWTIYNTIREVEYTFRVLKTDLDLRPVFHKTDGASMAHLHLGLLAYWLVNTIRYQLKLKETHNEWRDIVRIMNTQKIVTTTMENNRNDLIVIRQCSEPSQKVMEIYHNLGFKPQPFSRKKFVVPKTEIPPAQSFDNQLALSG